MKWAGRGITLAMIVHLCFVWIASYDRGHLDDKAVHYYSAARLYADRAHAQAIANAYSEWISRLSLSRFYFDNRISSSANYVIPSSLLRLILQIKLFLSGSPPASFSGAVKYAFLLLYIFGLAWIAGITWRDPFMSVFLFSCLIVASFSGTPLSWITPDPGHDLAYFHYVPRGSAILLLLGVFAALQQKRMGMAGLSCLLLFGWHFGLAAVAVALVFIVLGLFAAAQLPAARLRMILSGMLFLSGVFVAFAAARLPPAIYLWIPLIIVCVLMAAGRAFLQNPWLAAVFLASAYLFLAQTAAVLLGYFSVGGWVSSMAGNEHIREFSFRLRGSMQVAAAVLLLAAVAGALSMALRRLSSLWRERAFLAAALALLIFAVYAQRDNEWMVLDGRSAFFWQEDVLVNRRELAPRDLHKLDPQDQAAFFASLGDFLLRPL